MCGVAITKSASAWRNCRCLGRRRSWFELDYVSEAGSDQAEGPVVELDSGLNVRSSRSSIQNDSYKFSLEQLGGAEGDEKDQRPRPSRLQLTSAQPTSCLLHAHPATLQLRVSLGHGKLWKDRIHHLHCFYFLWYFISWHQERKEVIYLFRHWEDSLLIKMAH